MRLKSTKGGSDMKGWKSILGGVVAMPIALSAAGAAADNTVGDVLAAIGQFDTFLDAVEQSGHGDVLAGEGPVSVFAPTDETIGEVGDDVDAFVAAHIAQAAVVGEESMDVEMMSGETVEFSQSDDGNTMGGVEIMVTGMGVDNGFIHVIEGPLPH